MRASVTWWLVLLFLILVSGEEDRRAKQQRAMTTMLEGTELERFNEIKARAFEHQRNSEWTEAKKHFNEGLRFYAESLKGNRQMMHTSFIEEEAAHTNAVHDALHTYTGHMAVEKFL
mmetsp:Transcript_15904/g.39213  ORF Transcript_15904/g.39213 Transcript_15904/m.39213 type:complete len:117 (-) Transcript_15904:64-414(-)